MKVAFIPPRGMMDYAKFGSKLMCLAQLLDDPEYAEAIRRLGRTKFTILDNGANEGKILTNEALAEASKSIQAGEIVLPDVLDDPIETLAASKEYLRHFRMPEQQYMGVLQGDTLQHLQEMVDVYAKTDVVTIGIPRRLINRMYQSVRIDMAIWIADTYPGRFKVHFLGASSAWVKEPYYVTKYETPVRSIDTSLPFSYGLAGVQLENSEGVTDKKIDRPKDYLTGWHTISGRTTILYNLEIYKEWCSGKTTPSGEL